MRGLMLLSVPVLGLALLLAAYFVGQDDASAPRRIARSSTAPDHAPTPLATPHVARSAPKIPRPPVVVTPEEPSPKMIAEAANRARVVSLYQNYRAAVATGNEQLRDSLLPVIMSDRKTALEFAQADAEQSITSEDRLIAESIATQLRK